MSDHHPAHEPDPPPMPAREGAPAAAERSGARPPRRRDPQRGRRRLAWTLGVVTALALAAGAAAWWMVATPSGARWGFERLGAIVPGKLEVRELHGPLRGPLEVRHFTYRNDRLEITADRLIIEWRLTRLFSRRLDIEHLYAENVRVLMGRAGDTPAERDSLDDGLPDVDLPVSIVVRDGAVDGLQITGHPDSTGLVIDRVTLDGSTLHDSLHIHRFVVRSQALDIDLAGRALPVGRYPLALEGRWTWRPPGGREIAGRGSVTGELGGTMRVAQTVEHPFAVDLDGRIVEALRRPRLEADVTFERLDLRVLDPAYPEGEFSGRVHVTGAVDDLAGHGSVMSRTEALGVAHTDVRFRHRDQTWWIDNLYLTLPGQPLELTARGAVTGQGPAMRMRFDAEWRRLTWPVRGRPLLESERGAAHVAGTPASFDVRLEARLAGRDLPPGRWWLDGHGGDGRLAIRTLIADVLEGRITGTGAVAWSPRVEWRLGFDGRGIDPGSVWREWPGSVAFTGRSEGTMMRRGPVGRMLVSRLGGTLRGDTLSGGGTLIARGAGYTLQDAAVIWGRDTLAASGDLIDRWDLTWRLAAPDLSQLPQGSGSLFAAGTVRGPRGRPHVIATAAGESLFHQRLHATTLRAAADLDFAPDGVLRVDAAVTELDVHEHSFARVTAGLRGTRGKHELRAALAGAADSLVAVLAGGLRDGVWNGHLTTLDLVKSETGDWSLGAPAALTASPRQATLGGFDWRSESARLTLAADWDARGPWRLDARLDSVRLALFQPFMPPETRMTGNLHGRIMARATPQGRLFADVDLVPGPGTIEVQTADGAWTPTRFENGALRAGADGQGLSASAAVDLVDVGTVRGSVTLPAYAVLARPAASQPVDGRLAIHLRDLTLLQGLSPDLESTRGTLDSELAFGGTLADPAVQGDLRVREGAADVPRFGLQLRQIALLATSSPGGRLALQGSMISGGGTLNVDGTADIGARGQPRARFTVSGERVQAINTRESQLVLSPDLMIALDGRRVDVSGEVRVPQGTVTLSRPGDRQIVRSSPDVVYASADTLARGAFDVYSRVRLVLGDDVRVQGFGVDLKPSGSLLATDAPGLPTLATGELTAREGRYRIYGQELAIERGRLIFGGGPITNPGLDIRAARRADDGTIAGFEVRGTLEQPDLRVFSEPSRGQSQALAYILFGRPIERTSLQQGQLVSTMATTMGLGSTEMLAHGIASGLGIEEVRVHAGADLQSTSLMLGTHLSPRLYLSYGIGLLESQPTAQLRYVISRRWTIEAETAQQNRVDVMFTLER